MADEFLQYKAFPNPLASDEEKDTYEYGLNFAQAIQYEWWFRPETGVGRFYDKRDKYHHLRLYARV